MLSSSPPPRWITAFFFFSFSPSSLLINGNNLSPLQWLLSPCHQRLLLSISDSIFLLSFILILLHLHRRRRLSPDSDKKPLLPKLTSSPTPLKLKLTIILFSLLTIYYAILFTLSLLFSTPLQCPNLSSILLLLRLLSHLFSTSVLLLLSNPFPFPFLLSLRLFFFSSFFFNSLFSISSFTTPLFPDDFIILSVKILTV